MPLQRVRLDLIDLLPEATAAILNWQQGNEYGTGGWLLLGARTSKRERVEADFCGERWAARLAGLTA